MIGTFSVVALFINLAFVLGLTAVLCFAWALSRKDQVDGTADVDVKEGKRGRWRWYAYGPDGGQLSQSPPSGFATFAEAANDACVELRRRYRVNIVSLHPPAD